MRQPTFVSFVIFSLVVSSVIIPSVPHQTVPIIHHDIAAQSVDDQLERVYGVDKSWDVFCNISKTSFINYVRILTENGSRWIQGPDLASSQNTKAREWIINELIRVSNGRIEVKTIGKYKSVVGRLPGYLPVKAPVFLVGGHYDSVSISPGANDDGTGVATMLEIARIMSQYSWPLDIYFGAWNAEEIGLYGSKEVAQEFTQQGIDILVHYNIDMLLVPNPHNKTVLMAYLEAPYHIGHYWADLSAQMSKNYGQGIITPISSADFSAWERSDHYSFIEYGYGSSLFAHESGSAYDRWYHTAGDSWDNPSYDYDIATQAVKAIGASMAFTMSRAYGEPVRNHKTFNLLPGHEKNYYMTISGPTTINVTGRWYGGGTTFALYDTSDYLIKSFVSNDTSPWESQIVIQAPVIKEGIYHLRVFNHRGTTAGYEISWGYDTDIDNNDVPDSQEFWIDDTYFKTDTDSDTISDADEMILGTAWDSDDTDLDLMPDNYEIDNKLDPLDSSDAVLDNDGDTLTNLEEYQFGSNPWLYDTDNDSLPDAWEYQYGLNPLLDDSLENPDEDYLTNLEEYQKGTDPNVADVIPFSISPGTLMLVGVVTVVIIGALVWYRRY